MSGGEGRRSRNVVRMTMRDENLLEERCTIRETARDGIDVTRLANPCVDQRSGAMANEKIGVVAGTGHGAGIARVKPDRIEHGMPLI